MTLQALRALRQRLYHQTLAHCFDPAEDWLDYAALSYRATRMLKLVQEHQYLKCRNRLP
jgi:hypothetical protein